MVLHKTKRGEASESRNRAARGTVLEAKFIGEKNRRITPGGGGVVFVQYGSVGG